jgi:hypothetical protein
MELLTRLPPARLALEPLQRIPERGDVRRGSMISEVLCEATPPAPRRSVVPSEYLLQEPGSGSSLTR